MTFHWSREKDKRRAHEATVYRVHQGPSNSLSQNPNFAPSELHKHVFWVETNCGVMDLLAYNEEMYQSWIKALGDIAQGTPEPRQTETETTEADTPRKSAVPHTSRWAIIGSKNSVAPALSLEKSVPSRSSSSLISLSGRAIATDSTHAGRHSDYLRAKVSVVSDSSTLPEHSGGMANDTVSVREGLPVLS